MNLREGGLKEAASKTATLEQLAPVLTFPDLTLVSVQYDAKDDASLQEIEEVRAKLGINIHRFDDLDTFNDLDGVAALIEACDVALGPKTATLHIAGGLGKPTLRWCATPDQFSLGQNTCPFTPSVRDVIPTTFHDKDEIVRLLTERLPAFIAEHTQHRARYARNTCASSKYSLPQKHSYFAIRADVL